MSKHTVAFGGFVFAAILSASPANAHIVVWAADLEPNHANASHAMVSNNVQNLSQSLDVCGIFLEYEQRMTLGDGPSRIVYTDFAYTVGRKNLYLLAECDGYLIFEAYSCPC